MEDRPCAHCGAGFRVNPRSSEQHRFCEQADCQRERRRLSQRERRFKKGVPRLSGASRLHRAEYMRAYRDERAGYREREREAAARRRGRGLAPPEPVVTEAGLEVEPARVYVVRGAEGAIRLRVVTDAGWSATACVADVYIDARAVVTEAG
jgi:hypothetical protein